MPLNNPGGGGPLSQSDVTASRAIDGTAYHNTGATARYVLVSIEYISGVANNVEAFSDGNANPTLRVAYTGKNNFSGVTRGAIFFIVLPGNYYKVFQSGGATLAVWIEYE